MDLAWVSFPCRPRHFRNSSRNSLRFLSPPLRIFFLHARHFAFYGLRRDDRRAGRRLFSAESDSPKIVIDEIAGFSGHDDLASDDVAVPPRGIRFCFACSTRVKPGPIGYLDRKVKGGLGVVVDDLAAGIVANIVLQIIYYSYKGWLGEKLPQKIAQISHGFAPGSSMTLKRSIASLWEYY